MDMINFFKIFFYSSLLSFISGFVFTILIQISFWMKGQYTDKINEFSFWQDALFIGAFSFVLFGWLLSIIYTLILTSHKLNFFSRYALFAHICFVCIYMIVLYIVDNFFIFG